MTRKRFVKLMMSTGSSKHKAEKHAFYICSINKELPEISYEFAWKVFKENIKYLRGEI